MLKVYFQKRALPRHMGEIEMAKSINITVFSGRITADPQFSMAGDTPKAVFSLAVDEEYTDKKTGEEVKNTKWPRIEVYGALVEAVVRKYCTKGRWIVVNCKYEERTYDPKKNKNYVPSDDPKKNEVQYFKYFKIDQVSGGITLGPDGNGNGGIGNVELLLSDLGSMMEFKEDWKNHEVMGLLSKMIENRSKKKEEPVKTPATNGPDASAGPIPF